MNSGHMVVRFYFLNSGNLICRSTDISMYFRESLGVRDNGADCTLQYTSYISNRKSVAFLFLLSVYSIKYQIGVSNACSIAHFH